MGYSTDFQGHLKFTRELTTPELAKLNTLLDADYVDLELLRDFTGIQWDGTEKTRDMDEAVNNIIREMRETAPDFGLSGVLNAQGEDGDDRWDLVIGPDGLAFRQDNPRTGTAIICPHCDRKIYVDEAKPAK